MFSPSYRSFPSKITSPSHHPTYPLTPDGQEYILSDDEISMSEDCNDQVEMSAHNIIEPDMVYFAVHRPLRFIARDRSAIQDIEDDAICYVIHDPRAIDRVNTTAPSDDAVIRFTGAELANMIDRYPNAIFYVLQNPTWAEIYQLDELLDQYPDSVVYYVPRPKYLQQDYYSSSDKRGEHLPIADCTNQEPSS
ncbi:hypothetical protein Unana1_00807 [Umbelopsis nana]